MKIINFASYLFHKPVYSRFDKLGWNFVYIIITQEWIKIKHITTGNSYKQSCIFDDLLTDDAVAVTLSVVEENWIDCM